MCCAAALFGAVALYFVIWRHPLARGESCRYCGWDQLTLRFVGSVGRKRAHRRAYGIAHDGRSVRTALRCASRANKRTLLFCRGFCRAARLPPHACVAACQASANGEYHARVRFAHRDKIAACAWHQENAALRGWMGRTSSSCTAAHRHTTACALLRILGGSRSALGRVFYTYLMRCHAHHSSREASKAKSEKTAISTASFHRLSAPHRTHLSSRISSARPPRIIGGSVFVVCLLLARESRGCATPHLSDALACLLRPSPPR